MSELFFMAHFLNDNFNIIDNIVLYNNELKESKPGIQGSSLHIQITDSTEIPTLKSVQTSYFFGIGSP